MQVQFKISRQKPNGNPYFQTFLLEVEAGMTILDCLNQIKWEQDGSLAFRKNCRNTICGSCSIKINGRSALACKENVGSELRRFFHSVGDDIPEIAIAPMGNFTVMKDLIVDMQPFWDNLEKVDPYVSTNGRAIPEREFLQTPEEREQLNEMGNCILCGACYSECNAKSVNPSFVGPHALAKAQRLDRKDAQSSRSVRHRKVLVDLVKAGGWVDERKFGLYVMGNYFRDLGGIASILPLGLKMLSLGKFPTSFEASEGTQEVRSLIEAVQTKNHSEKP